jgi:hypothetical protein
MKHFLRMKLILLAFLPGLVAGCGGEAPPTLTPSGDTGVQITMTTDPDPARAGTVTLTFAIQDAASKPVTDADTQVHVTGDMPSMGHGGLEGDATYMGEGKWQVRGRLSMGGEWRIIVKIDRNGALLTQREFRVQAQG